MAANNPSFEPPNDDSDHEIWILRAPVSFNIPELLNGVTLSVHPESSATNNILSRFKSDDSEYLLTQGDASEYENLRLLVPDKASPDGGELIAHRPFQRQIHLTSTVSHQGSSDVREDLFLAPAEDVAPKPAVGQLGNGSVDSMRLAYVPVPQRQGLKRRWAMPGSKSRESYPSSLYSVQNQGHIGDDEIAVTGDRPRISGENQMLKKKDGDAVVSDDEPQKKRVKKEKKKKEKKRKKSSKK